MTSIFFNSIQEDLIWRRVVRSYKEFYLALKDFSAKDVDRVKIIHKALNGGERKTAAFLLQYLKEADLKLLFDEMVTQAAISQGDVIEAFRGAILSLPHDWVLERIEIAAEPVLVTGTYWEYRRLLELYIRLDREITLKLARRAASNPDYDIREAGEDYIALIESQGTDR